MKSWFEHSFCEAEDTAPLAQAKLGRLVEELGLDWFAYVMLRTAGRPTGEVDIASTALTNYPAEFVGRYLQGRYERLDPVCDLAARSVRPFFWGHGCFLRAFRQPQRRVLDEARAFGIVSGLAIPLHGPDGAVGVFCVADGGEKRVRDAVRGEHERLFAAAYDAHDFALGVAAAPGPPEPSALESRLSVRERECLLWTAEGKTAEEVASVLGLSVFTVNRHVSVATRKLKCTNKHHAAIRALRAGLI